MRDQVLLSVFALAADGELVWKRVDAISGSETELTTLPVASRPLQRDVHIHPRGAEAMILLGRSSQTIHRVALDDGRILPVPSPAHELILDVGYDAEGRALYFYGDQTGPGSPRHLDVLASVYREGEGGQLDLVEKKATTPSWPGDLRQLDTRMAAPTSVDIRVGEVAFLPKSMLSSDPWSKEYGQANEYLEWYRSDRGTRKVFFRAYRESRGLAPAIVVEAASGRVRLSAWDSYSFYSSDLQGEIRGGHLLLTNASSVARLHELETGATVWESPPQARVWLWPVFE